MKATPTFGSIQLERLANGAIFLRFKNPFTYKNRITASVNKVN
jgi:hypothetical protein